LPADACVPVAAEVRQVEVPPGEYALDVGDTVGQYNLQVQAVHDRPSVLRPSPIGCQHPRFHWGAAIKVPPRARMVVVPIPNGRAIVWMREERWPIEDW
jgi:hypothetical protein